jgi:hypothetical protein
VNTAIARSGTRNAGDPVDGDSTPIGAKLLRMPPEKAADIILRATSRGRPRVLVGGDARAAYLLSSLSRTGWHRLAAYGFGRMRHQTRSLARPAPPPPCGDDLKTDDGTQ